MKEKMKLCCHVAMMKQEKNRGDERAFHPYFSRPHDRKSIFLSCGLFAFGRNGKFTSLSQRMSKALSIVRAGGDLNPSEPEPNPSHSQIPDKGEIHERKRKRKQRRAPARYVR